MISELNTEILQMQSRKEVYLERGNVSMAEDCQWRLDGMREGK